MSTNMVSVKVVKEGFGSYKVGRMLEVTMDTYESNKKYLKPTLVAKSSVVTEPSTDIINNNIQ